MERTRSDDAFNFVSLSKKCVTLVAVVRRMEDTHGIKIYFYLMSSPSLQGGNGETFSFVASFITKCKLGLGVELN